LEEGEAIFAREGEVEIRYVWILHVFQAIFHLECVFSQKLPVIDCLLRLKVPLQVNKLAPRAILAVKGRLMVALTLRHLIPRGDMSFFLYFLYAVREGAVVAELAFTKLSPVPAKLCLLFVLVVVSFLRLGLPLGVLRPIHSLYVKKRWGGNVVINGVPRSAE